jgi:hypothetical protein
MRLLIQRPAVALTAGVFTFNFGPAEGDDLIRVLGVSFVLVTDANVANRRIRCALAEQTQFLTGPLWSFDWKMTQTAGRTNVYTAVLNGMNPFTDPATLVLANDEAAQVGLPSVVFERDVTFSLTVSNVQAADAISRFELQYVSGRLDEILT